jgi:hypothetical protein
MEFRLTLLFLILWQWIICQDFHEQYFFDSTYYTNNTQSHSLTKFNINCPKELELPLSITLDHFPDLQAKKILIKERRIKTTMNARPTFGSLLFAKRTNRTYVVRINTSSKDSVIRIAAIPFNAKIGLFAHEFSHFTDYQTLSFFGVIGRGFSYLSKKSKMQFEKEIDQKTIERGLGWQLYDWSDYVLNRSNASTAYKQFKAETYMTPNDIKRSILRLFPQ